LELLSRYDLPLIPHRLTTSPEEAARAARTLGCPVAMKVVAAHLIHKSDVGGVSLNISTPEEAAELFTALYDRLTPHVTPGALHGILVEKMADPGIEVIVGMVRDMQFGPAIMVGLGGVFVELYKDVTFRLPPLSFAVARSMFAELRAAPLLTGYRGQAPRDLDALAGCASTVARIAAERADIQEIDLNPIIAYERGCTIVDAKIRVGL
ncbi:MAG TPA: acetate--CoA ligase family protein, partial [Candidatus Acidoferrum sp.]|nr:acetate--CoA ligase family protein [Candidatus Acidoferrum sp.]